MIYIQRDNQSRRQFIYVSNNPEIVKRYISDFVGADIREHATSTATEKYGIGDYDDYKNMLLFNNTIISEDEILRIMSFFDETRILKNNDSLPIEFMDSVHADQQLSQ